MTGPAPQETTLELVKPDRPALSVFPNPTTKSTRIQYGIPANARINISVYDAVGREVSVVFNGERATGVYNAEFNAARLPSGVYYIRMVASMNGKNIVQTQKLTKLD